MGGPCALSFMGSLRKVSFMGSLCALSFLGGRYALSDMGVPCALPVMGGPYALSVVGGPCVRGALTGALRLPGVVSSEGDDYQIGLKGHLISPIFGSLEFKLTRCDDHRLVFTV